MISTLSAMFSQLWDWLSFIVGHSKSGQDAHQSIQRESESESVQTESESDLSESTLKNQSEEKCIQSKVKHQHASFTEAPEFNMVAEHCHPQGQGCQPGVRRVHQAEPDLNQSTE
eukprot:4152858-Amphidinium_carterae.1